MSNETTQKRSLSVSLGAAFLMATSAIGPGFLTQTSQFTAKYLSSFAFVIVCVIIMDMIAQTNVWSIVGVSGLRGQEIANKVLPGLGYLLVVLVVLGGLAFNIGNVGGVSLGFNAMIGIPEKAGVIIGTFLVILTAYTMSRFTFAARKPMMKITMVLGMFPSFMGMIAVYLLMTQFNLINHLWGLILIYSAGAPMGYLTQKGFFDTIPKAIDEAARIDGATNFQVFMKINLPLSRPIIVYTALSSFTWPWSDFILPKLLLKEKNLYTVAVGLMSLDETEFARFAAGSVFIAVPIVLLYFFLVKDMVNGMAAGAVKG